MKVTFKILWGCLPVHYEMDQHRAEALALAVCLDFKPPVFADADGTVYVQAEFMNSQPLRDGATRKPRFLHLETQLAKNKHHKRILRRLFRPGVKFWGNEYVEHMVDVEATGSGSFLLDTIPEAESAPAPTDSSSPRQSPPQLRSITNMNVAQVWPLASGGIVHAKNNRLLYYFLVLLVISP